jgi:hypothetical protein
MTKDDYVCGVRYHLNLPQMIRPGDTRGALMEEVGEHADMAVCAVDHGTTKVLDPTGSHATVCKTGAKGRYMLHGGVNHVCGKFGDEAGGAQEREPGTAGLLMDKFSPAQCRLMFLKNASIAGKQRQAVMTSLSQSYAGMRQGTERTTIAQAMTTLAAETPKEWKGLRIDRRVVFPDMEVWIDVGTVHPTSCSTERAVTLWNKRLFEAGVASRGVLSRNRMAREASPTVATACRTKHARYAPMVKIAEDQKKKGQRAFAPRFFAAIVSHSGEFAPELMGLIELFTKQYAKHITKLGLEDGVTIARRTSDYRCRFKDALATTVMAGFGRVLGQAGRAWDGGEMDPLLDEGRQILPSRDVRL